MESPTEENIKLIFGLKIKNLRQQLALSLQSLSKASGISVSYINEIENGKKYPKADKINLLARALGVSYDSLVSLKLNRALAPVGQFLDLEVINDFLFETFGIDKGMLLSMVASQPVKVSAFINSLFEISRNYHLELSHFFFSCLRSYQELHENYFEEIEQAVDDFKAEMKCNDTPPIYVKTYQQLLTDHYQYQIAPTDFSAYPALRHLRSVTIPSSPPRLLYNAQLSYQQTAFLYGRELGFSYLKIDKRPYTTSWLRVESFDQVLNNFKASYFAQALHINRELLRADLDRFFGSSFMDGELLIQLLERYNTTPEMLLTRITNLLPRYFGIHELFLIRYSSKEPSKNLKEISKELHLSKNATNIAYNVSEQNYRRWITKSLLKYMLAAQRKETTKVEAVISQNANGNEYLTISILRPMTELNNNNNSVTIGFVLTDAIKKRIRFLGDEVLHISKLGPLDRNEFENPQELARLAEQHQREAALALLMKEYGAG